MPELLISTRDQATGDLLQAATTVLDGIRVRRAHPESLPRILEDPEAVDALLLDIPLDDRDPAFVLPKIRSQRPKLPIVAVFPEGSPRELKRLRTDYQLQSTLVLPVEPFALLQRITRLVRSTG